MHSHLYTVLKCISLCLEEIGNKKLTLYVPPAYWHCSYQMLITICYSIYKPQLAYKTVLNHQMAGKMRRIMTSSALHRHGLSICEKKHTQTNPISLRIPHDMIYIHCQVSVPVEELQPTTIIEE